MKCKNNHVECIERLTRLPNISLQYRTSINNHYMYYLIKVLDFVQKKYVDICSSLATNSFLVYLEPIGNVSGMLLHAGRANSVPQSP